MPEIISYKTVEPYLSDFLIGTDISDENVTRNFKVSEIVNTILAALNIGTVTSISTASSSFISVTGGPITTTGTISMALSATGFPGSGNYLRGDGTWSEPGPTPTDIAVYSSGSTLTNDVESLNYTGNGVTAASFNNEATVDIPGAGSTVDSLIAGAGISVNNAGITSVTITNDGVTQVRAGGNVTLSGGTGAVTVNTTKNAGTVTTVNAGLGLESTNGTTNPEIDVDFTTTNNYISNVPTTGVTNLNDTIAFHDLTASSVKTSRFREIPASILTQLKSYIDTNDENKVKNDEPVGYDEVAKATQMVSLTIAEYNQIITKDPNTLYFIIGAGTSYTTTLVRDTTNIDTTNMGTGSYSLSTTINGVPGTSITGPAGTNYTFVTTITGNNATITNSNMPLTTTGTIQVNGNTETQNLSATVTQNVTPSVRAALSSITLGGNLGNSGAEGAIWDYAPYNQLTQDYDRPASADPGQQGWFPWNVDPKFGFATDNGSGYVYSFNSRLLLLDTNTYKWAAGSEDSTDAKYLATGYDGSSWSQSWATGTVYSSISQGQTNVTHAITGTWEFRTDYGSTLTVDTSRITLNSGGTAPANTYSLSALTSSTPTTTGTGTITGARYNETATWVSQIITGVNNQYVPSVSTVTYQNLDGSPATLTNTVANPNSTKTVYAVCNIVYTPSASPQYRKLDATTQLNGAVTSTNGQYTLNNAIQEPNGASSGTYAYNTPSIVANAGYKLSTTPTISLANIGTNGTITFNSSPWGPNSTSADGGGTSNSDRAIENAITISPPTTTIVEKEATIRTQISSSPSVSCVAYNISVGTETSPVTFDYTDCGTGTSASTTLTPSTPTSQICSRTLPTKNKSGATIASAGTCGTPVPITYTCEWTSDLATDLNQLVKGNQSVSGPSDLYTSSGFFIGTAGLDMTVNRTGPDFGQGNNVIPVGKTLTITWPGGTTTQVSAGNAASGIQGPTFNGAQDGGIYTVEITEN